METSTSIKPGFGRKIVPAYKVRIVIEDQERSIKIDRLKGNSRLVARRKLFVERLKAGNTFLESHVSIKYLERLWEESKIIKS